ncbi:hypothetical protein AB0F52_46070 [Amycolatopsis sp. NPDC024027]|uniref:hypothetical protein n=1 Tax=Amycolatopsis sp. NPDC024027 TaxID=3154327 RepID=UPI0033E1AC80
MIRQQLTAVLDGHTGCLLEGTRDDEAALSAAVVLVIGGVRALLGEAGLLEQGNSAIKANRRIIEQLGEDR